MREVSVRVARRSNALIDLKYVHVCPGNVFIRKSTKHHPWCVTSADSHDETAACGDSVARLRGDHRGRFLSDCVRIRKHFSSHFFSPYVGLYIKFEICCFPL